MITRIANSDGPSRRSRASTGDRHIHANYGISGSLALPGGLRLGGFVLGSHTDKQLILGASDAANGVAAKVELTSERGFGVLAT